MGALFYITGICRSLTVSITTAIVSDTEKVRVSTEKNLLKLLSSEEKLASLAQKLSEELEAEITLKNVRPGSIKVDMTLEDMACLEYIKELSDQWVLSNIVDSILMTPEFTEQFIDSCHKEQVSIKFVLDKDSYQQVKSLISKYKLHTVHIVP